MFVICTSTRAGILSTNDPVGKLKTVEIKINNIAKEIYFLTNKINEEQKNLKINQEKYNKLEYNQQILIQNLDIYIRQQYLLSKTNVAQKLFNTTSPNQFSKMIAFYKYLALHSENEIQNIQFNIKQNLDLKQTIQKNLLSLNSQKDRKTKELEKLRQLYKERALILAQMKQQAQDTSLLPKTSSILMRRYQKLKLINAASPLDPEQALKLSSSNLLPAAQGAKVFSIYPGKIIFASWLKGFGLMIIIDHGNNIMSLYGHNQAIFKTVGAWVNKGEVIALVGESGGQQKAALYFEIRKNGLALANTDL